MLLTALKWMTGHQEALMKKNKILLTGIFSAIFIGGLGVIMSSNSISLGELFGSFRELNPRIMSLLALPIVALLFVLGVYLRKKSEERKWKKALLRTRAKKQK
jgi:hypothetical protein